LRSALKRLRDVVVSVQLAANVTVDISARTVQIGERRYQLEPRGPFGWRCADPAGGSELAFVIIEDRKRGGYAPRPQGRMDDGGNESLLIGRCWVDACAQAGAWPFPAS